MALLDIISTELADPESAKNKWGQDYLTNHLKQTRKIKLSHNRVGAVLRGFDPQAVESRKPAMKVPTRGVYTSLGVRQVYHADQHEKIMHGALRVMVYGTIDGSSEKILHISVLPSKAAELIFQVYWAAALEYGLPFAMRTDRGREATIILFSQLNLNLQAWTGKSTANQRVLP